MSMYSIERSVKEYLDSQSWRYKHDEEKHRFIFGMKLDCENVDGCMLAVTARDEEDLSCKALYEFKVPEARRAAVTEFITRANYGLFLGNFQMDLNDGELIYQTYAAFYDQRAMQQEVRRVIQVAIHMAERYGQGIYDVINHGVNPEDAVKFCEEDGNQGKSMVSGGSSGAAAASATTSTASSAAVAAGPNEFSDLVAEMTDEQLDAVISAAQWEKAERIRKAEEERRRREEEERRRREEEEAARKAAPLSLKDKLRRLIGNDGK
ncbi:MAG: YbjN domain-containing protein [Oscillospiraceae bacterium]|nr:YbjN domain-containing protein [Oscillospiraceae bacterium]